MHDAAARDAAIAVRREMGSELLARDRARDVWIAPWLQSLSQDVRFAARLLLKDRGYAMTAILTLSLGLGIANTLITIINASQRGLPLREAHRVMFLGTRDAKGQTRGVSILDYEDWRAQTKTFDDLAAFSSATMNVSAVPSASASASASASRQALAPESVAGAFVSANAFRVLGVAPHLGRDLRDDDDRPGAPAVVILSHSVWLSRHAGDASVIGQTILVNAVPAVVIGVMPEGFGFPFNDAIWLPLAARPSSSAAARGERTLNVFGRLANGATLAQARADIDAIATRLATSYPDTNRDVRAHVESFNAHYNGRVTEPMTMALLGAVGFVLLIACANVANLQLARAAHRAREIAVRTSLGATRLRIVRQLIVESLLLASLAGLAGVALSTLGVRLFAVTVADLQKPYWVRFDMDWRVFSLLATLCVATAFLFGLAPALHLAKTRVGDALKEGARAGFGSLRTRRWTSALIVAELALTVMLLAGGSLMLRSFLTLYRADRGVDAEPALALRLSLPAERYASDAQRAQFYRSLQGRLDAHPAIAAAAVSSHLPFAGANDKSVEIDGHAPKETVPTMAVSPRYFEAIGLPLLRGRAFTDADDSPGQASAIVNQLFVARYLTPDADPIGRRIRIAGSTVTIVGVAATMRQRPFRAPDPLVYVPMLAEPPAFASLIVRARTGGGPASGDPAALTPMLREEVRAIDPDLALFGVMPLTRLATLSRWLNQIQGLMFIVFASTALLLSAIGLAGVTAYAVTQRTQEIGLRIALGATSSGIAWLFARRMLLQLALGLALGFAGAQVTGRLLGGALIKIGPGDPVTLAGIALILTLVCAAACYVPTRRAARLDALTALRRE